MSYFTTIYMKNDAAKAEMVAYKVSKRIGN
jgi:hypothetical protein